MLVNPKVGSDPELFIVKADHMYHEPDSIFCIPPQHRLVDGRKGKPHIVDDDGTGIQVDGAAVEINTVVARLDDGYDEVLRKIGKSLDNAMKYIKRVYLDSTVSLYPYPAARLNEHWLSTYPELALSGCDPDYNVWSMSENPPIDYSIDPYHYAGGHVHISWDKPDFYTQVEVIKVLDMYLGMYQLRRIKVSHDHVLRKQYLLRARHYGKAGNFRPKEYGVEYRTPSSWWVMPTHRPEMIRAIYNAINAFNQGLRIVPGDEKLITDAINELDPDSYKGLWPHVFGAEE